MKNVQTTFNSPFLYNIYQYPGESAVCPIWISILWVLWGKFLAFLCHRSIAGSGSLKDIVQHPQHKSQLPRSSLCLQITNYCGTCHSPSAGLLRNTKKKNGTEIKTNKQKRNYCKMLPQASYITATLIQSWPWAAFHLNAGHGLANHGSGEQLMSSSSQGKLCSHTGTGATPEWVPSNMEHVDVESLAPNGQIPSLMGQGNSQSEP